MFFDAATTQMRADLVSQAIEAAKHVYCEKPTADTLDKAVAVARRWTSEIDLTWEHG